jgi:uncharacterized protein with PIN domain
MTYLEAAYIADHPTEHWDALNREWDDDMVEALDMLAGLAEEAERKEPCEFCKPGTTIEATITRINTAEYWQHYKRKDKFNYCPNCGRKTGRGSGAKGE